MKLTQFLQRATRLQRGIVEKCSDHFQGQVANHGAIMLFTPLFAAVVIGFGVARALSMPWLGLGLALLILPLVYLSEVATTTMIGKPSWSNWMFRGVLFAGFVGIHLLSADLCVFRPEIEKEAYHRWLVKNNNEIASIDAQITEAEQRRTTYRMAIDSVRNVQRAERGRILEEIDKSIGNREPGYGEIAKKKESMVGEDDEQIYQPAIAAYEEDIQQLENNTILPLRALRQSTRAKEFDYGTLGLAARLDILHDIARGPDGAAVLWLIFVVIFLIAAVDFLPIIHRSMMAFEEYSDRYEEQQQQDKLARKFEDAKKKAQDDADATRFVNNLSEEVESDNQLNTQRQKSYLHREKSKLIVKRFEESKRAILQVMIIAQEGITELPHDAREQILRAYRKTLRQLGSLMNDEEDDTGTDFDGNISPTNLN